MKVIIAGSRTLGSRDLEESFKEFKPLITEVVCGCATGIDRMGYEWAREHKIPVVFFPAWTDQYSWAWVVKKPTERIHYPKGGYQCERRLCGFKRNNAMAKYGEFLQSVLDVSNGRGTNGTLNMITEAQNHGLGIHVFKVDVAGLRNVGKRMEKGTNI